VGNKELRRAEREMRTRQEVVAHRIAVEIGDNTPLKVLGEGAGEVHDEQEGRNCYMQLVDLVYIERLSFL
jgi:hypothetical protein